MCIRDRYNCLTRVTRLTNLLWFSVVSQNDWGPLDILILGALHREPYVSHIGLNARPKGLRAVLHSITRKRAIAKALQLKGHSDFAPVDMAYYHHFLFFFCSKILPFGKFRLATTNADLLI